MRSVAFFVALCFFVVDFIALSPSWKKILSTSTGPTGSRLVEIAQKITMIRRA